jgi:large subunit ribosomal protein L19
VDIVDRIGRDSIQKELPPIRPGDLVRVHFRVEEEGKSRVQVYEGIVIAIRGKGMGKTFTVRKVSFGVGVERIFPLYSPLIEKVEVVTRHKVRRAKLYFLREKAGKKARLKPIL